MAFRASGRTGKKELGAFDELLFESCVRPRRDRDGPVGVSHAVPRVALTPLVGMAGAAAPARGAGHRPGSRLALAQTCLELVVGKAARPAGVADAGGPPAAAADHGPAQSAPAGGGR